MSQLWIYVIFYRISHVQYVLEQIRLLSWLLRLSFPKEILITVRLPGKIKVNNYNICVHTRKLEKKILSVLFFYTNCKK